MTTTPTKAAVPATNPAKALVRTLVPFVYPAVAAIIARFGYHVSNATVIQIVAAGGTGLTIVLHLLEEKFPKVGILLGWLGAPVYAPGAKASLTAQVATLEAQLSAIAAQVDEAHSPSTPTAGAAPVNPA